MMNRDLFLAILAMDSYNRGYGQGIGGLPVNVGVTTIGDATIIRQSDTAPNSPGVNAGFYAIAYDVSGVAGFGTTEKVISYRGTDEPNPFAAHNDAVNAYGIALGAARRGQQAIHRSR